VIFDGVADLSYKVDGFSQFDDDSLMVLNVFEYTSALPIHL
jgi:hypothetical protein